MKSNLKGGNALVRFLLRHGEKLGLVAVAACVGMLIWSAIGRDRLGDNQTPARLNNVSTSASQRIESFTWEDAPEEEIVVADEVIGGEMKPIDPAPFPTWTHQLDRPVLDPMALRTDPLLLAAEELEVHGDAGLWASANPDRINQRRLEALAEQEREAKEREAERERARRESESGRRGRGGGRDASLFGGEGYGAAAKRDSEPGAEKEPSSIDPVPVRKYKGSKKSRRDLG